MATLATDYRFLDRSRAGADAFVHVGDRFDPDAVYLTRVQGPDRPDAFVATEEGMRLYAPALFAEQARRGGSSHFTGADAIRPDQTVPFDVSPQDPAGCYGDCSRTFVPDTGRDTERAWYDAVDAARESALDTFALGAAVEGTVVRQAIDESLAAHGVDTETTADDSRVQLRRWAFPERIAG